MSEILDPVNNPVVYHIHDGIDSPKIDYDNLTDAPAAFTSPLTTKGDIYARSTADARLAVGVNGQVLKAASAETTGLKWQYPQFSLYFSDLQAIGDWASAGSGHAISVATTDGAVISNGGAASTITVSKKTAYTGMNVFGNGKVVSLKLAARGVSSGNGNRNFYVVVGSLDESFFSGNPTNDHFGFWFEYSGGNLENVRGTSGNGTNNQNTILSGGSTTFAYYEAVFDGTSARFYIDGVLKATQATSVPATTDTGNLLTVAVTRPSGAEAGSPSMRLYNLEYAVDL